MICTSDREEKSHAACPHKSKQQKICSSIVAISTTTAPMSMWLISLGIWQVCWSVNWLPYWKVSPFPSHDRNQALVYPWQWKALQRRGQCVPLNEKTIVVATHIRVTLSKSLFIWEQQRTLALSLRFIYCAGCTAQKREWKFVRACLRVVRQSRAVERSVYFNIIGLLIIIRQGRYHFNAKGYFIVTI